MKELRFNKTWTFVFLILPLELLRQKGSPRVEPRSSLKDAQFASLLRELCVMCSDEKKNKIKSQSLSKQFLLTCRLQVWRLVLSALIPVTFGELRPGIVQFFPSAQALDFGEGVGTRFVILPCYIKQVCQTQGALQNVVIHINTFTSNLVTSFNKEAFGIGSYYWIDYNHESTWRASVLMRKIQKLDDMSLTQQL